LIGVVIGGVGAVAATETSSTDPPANSPTVTSIVRVPGPERTVTKTVPGPTRKVLAKSCRDALDIGKGNQDWGKTTMVIIFNDPDNADGSIQTYLKWKRIYEQLMATCLAQS
jgi:hypothetical protein